MRRRAAGSGTPATNAAVSGARSAAVRNTPPQVVSSTGSVGSAGQYDPVSRRSSTASSLLARPTPATSRVGPAAVGAELVGLFRAPGARFVLVQRGGVTQDRFHHLPLGLHGVLAGEQLAVALQGVTEQPLVGWPVLPCRSVATSSTSSPTICSPATLTRMPRAIRMSGLSRRRRWLERLPTSSPKTSSGGRRNSTTTSVAVSGRHLPARMEKGTPAQRQVSISSLTAT